MGGIVAAVAAAYELDLLLRRFWICARVVASSVVRSMVLVFSVLVRVLVFSVVVSSIRLVVWVRWLLSLKGVSLGWLGWVGLKGYWLVSGRGVMVLSLELGLKKKG